MKKIAILLMLVTSFTTVGQSADPGIGAMDITDINNVSLQASSLVANTTVLIKVPIQNLNETNVVNNGKVAIKLGSALTPDATYNLATAPLSNYFNWVYIPASKTIEGTLVAAFPADQYGLNAVFKLTVAASGTSSTEATFLAAPDENSVNNTATLNYNIVGSPLPVDLLSFNGKKVSANYNKLSWSTAKEKDFNYFEIQKSADAKSFEGFGKVEGTKQLTSYLQYYEFDDKEAIKPINYYRLKMVDVDGSFKYSNIISLQNEVGKSVVGEFYPNPAETYVQIDVISETEGEWNIITTDFSGRIIKTTKENLKKGGNRLNLNTSNFNTGITIVSFENSREGIRESRKILKK